MQWQHGHDKTKALIRDDDGTVLFEANTGEGKAYPFGPTCKFNGEVIPCLVYASKSGGITAEILVEVLTELDLREVFPRVEGAISVLLIDVHQSRLNPKFLTYINNQGHHWKVCLDVPHATSLWQVDDSLEKNGAAKTGWYRAKQELIDFERVHRLPCTISADDIIPLVNKIFHKAYGNQAANKKAIAKRGWFPPNRVRRRLHCYHT